jgi:hypothetical protein
MPHVSDFHAQHDPLLVASLAAGVVAGAERDRAAAQIADCADCAALHADLIAIARATAVLPPAVAPRDFRLSPKQAADLRPIGWRRLVASIGRSRPLMSRQLGIGMATIGLAGLLVSTLPGIQLGSTAAVPAASGAGPAEMVSGAGSSDRVGITAGGEASGAAAAAASAAPRQPGSLDGSVNPTSVGAGLASSIPDSGSLGALETTAPDSSSKTAQGRTNDNSTESTDQRDRQLAATPGDATTPSSDGGRNLLMTGSVLLLAAGIGLLAIRRLLRRPLEG